MKPKEKHYIYEAGDIVSELRRKDPRIDPNEWMEVVLHEVKYLNINYIPSAELTHRMMGFCPLLVNKLCRRVIIPPAGLISDNHWAKIKLKHNTLYVCLESSRR